MLYPRRRLTRYTILFSLGVFLSFAPYMPLLGIRISPQDLEIKR